MTRVLLHIGGEKTGSTYLQHWLHRNSRRLLERHGVLYPTRGPACLRRAHFPLAAALLPPQARDFAPGLAASAESLVDDLKRQLHRSGAHTLLLSAEHFASRLDLPALRRLRQLLGTDDVRIALYARRQDEIALSRFGTDLRNGRREDFHPATVGTHDRTLMPWRVASDWSSVFGTRQVRVRSYADAIRIGLARDLLYSLDLPDDGHWHDVPRANQRLDCDEARLLQLLNRHLPTWQEAFAAGTPQQHRRAVRLRDAALRHYRSRHAGRAAPLAGMLDAAERERLLARFAQDNQRLARQFAIVHAPTAAATAPLAPASTQRSCDHTLSVRLDDILATMGLRRAGKGIVPRWNAPWPALAAAIRRRLARRHAARCNGLLTAATALTSLGYCCI